MDDIVNSPHFAKLHEIIAKHPEEYFAEGNVWFEGGGNFELSARYAHVRANLVMLSRGASNILEVGFNAGHSCVLMLLANPMCKVTICDNCAHPYTEPCFEYIREAFPGRVELVKGDSVKTLPEIVRNGTHKYDMFHIDGNHDFDVVMQDVQNCRWLANPAHNVVVVHNDNLTHIFALNRQWVQRGFFKTLGQPFARKPDGLMDHFIAKYSFDPPNKVMLVARYNRGLEWLEDVPLARNSLNSVVVYNKGEDVPLTFSKYMVKNLVNVGLDQGSFLQYIVDHYDALPEVILFCQDDFDHHVMDPGVNTYNNTVRRETVNEFVEMMIAEATEHGHSQNAFTYLQFGPFAPHYQFMVPTQYEEAPVGMCFGQWFEKYLKREYPKGEFLWFKNAIFAVRKEYVLTRAKEEYEAILKQFITRKGEIDHFMERAWYYLLNLDRKLTPAMEA